VLAVLAAAGLFGTTGAAQALGRPARHRWASPRSGWRWRPAPGGPSPSASPTPSTAGRWAACRCPRGDPHRGRAPLTAALLGVTVLGERLGLAGVAGGALGAAGLVGASAPPPRVSLGAEVPGRPTCRNASTPASPCFLLGRS